MLGKSTLVRLLYNAFADKHAPRVGTFGSSAVVAPVKIDLPGDTVDETARVRLVDTAALNFADPHVLSSARAKALKSILARAHCVVFVFRVGSVASTTALLEHYGPLVHATLAGMGRQFVPCVVLGHSPHRMRPRLDDDAILEVLRNTTDMLSPWVEEAAFVEFLPDPSDLTAEAVDEAVTRVATCIHLALHYPVFPLWRDNSRTGFRPKVMAALTQIFVLLDEDENETLCFRELDAFSRAVFAQPLEVDVFRELMLMATSDGSVGAASPMVVASLSNSSTDLSAEAHGETSVEDDLAAIPDETIVESSDIGFDLTGFILLQSKMMARQPSSLWTTLRAYGFDSQFTQVLHPELLGAVAQSPATNGHATRPTLPSSSPGPDPASSPTAPEYMAGGPSTLDLPTAPSSFSGLTLLLLALLLALVAVIALEHAGLTTLTALGTAVRAAAAASHSGTSSTGAVHSDL
ncbi:uncharacterized protein AMSG_01793 [Thecamonas trahens ATCC 50062]|uniref:EF-hand domain-containing protein n=1 Tax=Thecamonas trahens ATCC 50062 TaxID=461836 RepID=A0A0L0DT52_THETB|nr:hypothetical protein AMSG_01793 [Thecamonas trahens ATCC 50062]KNC55529.1 hypothetical protein AMSG_01793 [Thecamonas trahens ATCC 50062]|eukprot:XP_013761305.1 hypothetical protein AMSG_01793 [Thecamonas trahens ATCC 50062]